MKTCFLSIILTSLCVASQDDAIVRFSNGDKLSGSAVALDLENLTWNSELLENQAKFKLEQIVDLQLPSKVDHDATEKASHVATVELTNGDIVKGLLTGLNDQEIQLKTWFAGDMVFRRLNVKAITISRNSKTLFRGPYGMDGWTLSGNEGAWTFDNNELKAESIGSIARDVDFTDESEIEFEMAWRGLLRSKLILFTSDITTASPETGYEITFQGSMIRIRRLGDDVWLGSKIVSRRMPPNEKAKVEVRVSKKSKKIVILMDDTVYGIWQDDGLDKVKGKGMMFVSETSSARLGISNIVVSEWDGFIDESDNDDIRMQDPRFGMGFNRGIEQPEDNASKELPEGRMMLANGDTIEGEVLGIKDEMIKIKTPFTEVKFPVNRINNIALKKASLETAKLEKRDIRAVLADGSKLVFRLDDVKDGKLIGYSQNFGNAEFVQTAFKRIEFNIYPKPKPKAK